MELKSFLIVIVDGVKINAIQKPRKRYFYRAHTKYDAKVMFSAFLSFCSQGGGGGKKLKNAQNVMGSPKSALKIFRTILPLTRCGGGGGP